MIDTWVFILLFCLYLYMFKIFHNKKLFKKGNKISYWHLCGMNKLQFTENNTSSHTAEFPWQSSASSTRGTGSIPGWGNKIPHVARQHTHTHTHTHTHNETSFPSAIAVLTIWLDVHNQGSPHTLVQTHQLPCCCLSMPGTFPPGELGTNYSFC